MGARPGTGVARGGNIAALPPARQRGGRDRRARAASAPVVAFGEDHSFPEPGWAEALLQAHRGPWAAVGPSIVNANPATAVSWATLLTSFGRWLELDASGPADAIAWHNSAYKREVLLGLGDELEPLLEVEGLLQAELAACSAIVNDAPHRSRARVAWSARQRAEVARRAAAFPWLEGYSFER
ncbi:MAG: hypothetical protein ABR599_11675 [Gemmatimonadota bacterium]